MKPDAADMRMIVGLHERLHSDAEVRIASHKALLGIVISLRDEMRLRYNLATIEDAPPDALADLQSNLDQLATRLDQQMAIFLNVVAVAEAGHDQAAAYLEYIRSMLPPKS